MKTRMDKGMSRKEYKTWMAAQNLAAARRELGLWEDNAAAELRRRGEVSEKTAAKLAAAKAELAAKEGA